ncbi:MAG: glycosyltransferase family 2 protein [Propionivibrio sp.]|uniref:glycosyltransferase family 2 protein n=1 Tax=Propionivibrio sp. TaxID=2212460 RepID=UPI0025FD9877|nr:glycosyltransferase family 2 protein [Propionivibrio sp.]MBK8893850.1 glycosyltransferase family 2 protein [Propionivibrio sp.]
MESPDYNQWQGKISIVVPVYRSQATLRELHRRLVSAVDPIDPHFELILVEDCGGDNSWEVIQELAHNDSRVRGIQLSRNFGQHAATICGFSHTRGKWVVTLDDDLEQVPEFIPQLYEKALEGQDLVYGVYPERTHKSWRNVTSKVARWLFNKAIPSLNYTYTSYRFIRGDLARHLVNFDSPFPFVDGYLSWLTNRYATVEVEHGIRAHGFSNYTLKKLITHTINIFVTFSDLPLRMATWAGLIAFMIGMLWLTTIVGRSVFGGISVSGYASIMAGILLFGGVQLLVLGVFGEYLGRMNFKSSRKPLFLVGHRTWSDRP